jgi:hypothetical protein
MIRGVQGGRVPTAPLPRRAPGEGRRRGATPPGKLRVLAVGTDDWAIEQAAASIDLAGHEVLRCHEPGESPFPCNALRPGRSCPLDIGIDAVVTSRARPTELPALGETGVICALHAGHPLIVTGISRNSPFSDLAERVVAEQGDLIEAIEDAAHHTQPKVIALTDVEP